MNEYEKQIKRLFLDSENLKGERVQMVKIDKNMRNMKGEREMSTGNKIRFQDVKNRIDSEDKRKAEWEGCD